MLYHTTYQTKYSHSHVSVAEVSKALEEVHKVLWLPHLHRRLKCPEGAITRQRATLSTYHLPQRLTPTRTIKVHMKLHLDKMRKRPIGLHINYSDTC